MLDSRMACNQACCAIVVDSKKVDNWFLFYYLMALRKRLIDLSVGSAQPNISSGIIKKLKIPNINIIDQNKFAKKLREIDLTSNSINSKIMVSQSLQKSLINQIF